MIVKRRKRIIAKSSETSKKYIKAAGEFGDEFDGIDDSDGLIDAIDDVADNIEDLQDAVDDMAEDAVQVAMNNNIADHFIAECDQCNGIFISAVVDSDQVIDHVSGTCPLCGRESDQYLKWVIRDVTDDRE